MQPEPSTTIVVLDLLAGRVPAVFRGELYATPALAGAAIVVVGAHYDLPMAHQRPANGASHGSAAGS